MFASLRQSGSLARAEWFELQNLRSIIAILHSFCPGRSLHCPLCIRRMCILNVLLGHSLVVLCLSMCTEHVTSQTEQKQTTVCLVTALADDAADRYAYGVRKVSEICAVKRYLGRGNSIPSGLSSRSRRMRRVVFAYIAPLDHFIWSAFSSGTYNNIYFRKMYALQPKGEILIILPMGYSVDTPQRWISSYSPTRNRCRLQVGIGADCCLRGAAIAVSQRAGARL
eukprot:4346574-Pleurochrysis_carterae.AAC.1